MGDEVVVQVEVFQGRGELVKALDVLDTILSEADAGDLAEALETEGRDGADAGVGNDDLVGVGILAVEEV